MPHYILKTLGCKANLSDSQLIEKKLQNRGWIPQEGSHNPIDLCIINSCTVTHEADRQTRKIAAKLSRDHPQAVVVVTGCAAEVNPEDLSQSPGVHFVVGNQNKIGLVDQVLKKIEIQSQTQITSDILNPKILGKTKKYTKLLSKHPDDRDWPSVTESFEMPPTSLIGHSSRTRSFIKIQEGCNSFCTYCIIPYGRGPSRSLKITQVIQQIQQLVNQGVREIVLTGTNIGDYGTDWNSFSCLEDLLEIILSSTNLERLRLSSLDPTEISSRLLDLMSKNSRLCSHFHISLQSPHSRVLRTMKRNYGFQEIQDCLKRISRLSTGTPSKPNQVFVGMDIITGFPGETNEEFEWSYQALNSLPWNRLHVFPYSEREGTPAIKIPGVVPKLVRFQRAKKLIQLSLNRLKNDHQILLKDHLESQSPIHDVLLERKGDSPWISGYSKNYLRVLIRSEGQTEKNQVVSVYPIDLMIDSKNHDVAFIGKLKPTKV